jgi:hypothetical protein
MDGRFIAYFRVSTEHQGGTGNGMAAQRKAVLDHLNGGNWKLVGEFTEVESGKRSDRPELERALAACRKHRAKLVIAKLDRSSRNVHFISGLMERKVDFVACDMPSATPFMLHVYAAVAEEERRMIAKRTKDGLAAAKARGVVLRLWQRPTTKPLPSVRRHCGRCSPSLPACRPAPLPQSLTGGVSPPRPARRGPPWRCCGSASGWQRSRRHTRQPRAPGVARSGEGSGQWTDVFL